MCFRRVRNHILTMVFLYLGVFSCGVLCLIKCIYLLSSGFCCHNTFCPCALILCPGFTYEPLDCYESVELPVPAKLNQSNVRPPPPPV